MANRRAKGRNVNGVLLLDKPIGRTSNHVLQEVKRLYQARKAGHTGSLDPLATGLLPICFGEATKISGFLLEADKHYRLKAQLGITTNTGDADGEVLETRDIADISEAQLKTAVDSFKGPIEQIPPMFSALKHKGQPLYKLARQGIEIERQPRPVQIHSIDFIGFEAGSMELQVHCSKGTYIRTLAEDIGAQLGCGAHITHLHRLGVGPYYPEQMITIEELRALAEQSEGDWSAMDCLLEKSDTALAGNPELTISSALWFYLRDGQAVQVPGAPTTGLVRLYNTNQQFLGMGIIQEDGKVAPKRLFAH